MGGLQPMTAFRDLCAAMNLPHTCDDAWGGDIIAAACAHIGATVKPSLLEASGSLLCVSKAITTSKTGSASKADTSHAPWVLGWASFQTRARSAPR
jgi:hypothetical protein